VRFGDDEKAAISCWRVDSGEKARLIARSTGGDFDGRVYPVELERGDVKEYFKKEGTVSEWWDPEERPGLFRDLYVQQRSIVREFFDPKDKIILDAGTGKGRFAIDFARAGAAHIFATDISEEMISIAKRRATESRVDSGVSFEVMDIEDLKFENDFFDVALCMETFVHLPSPQKGMNELVRVVKPGGLIASSVTLPMKKWYLNAGKVSNINQFFEFVFTPVYESRAYQNGLRKIFGRPRLVGRPLARGYFMRLFSESGLSVQREVYLGHPNAPRFLLVAARKPV